MNITRSLASDSFLEKEISSNEYQKKKPPDEKAYLLFPEELPDKKRPVKREEISNQLG